MWFGEVPHGELVEPWFECAAILRRAQDEGVWFGEVPHGEPVEPWFECAAILRQARDEGYHNK